MGTDESRPVWLWLIYKLHTENWFAWECELYMWSKSNSLTCTYLWYVRDQNCWQRHIYIIYIYIYIYIIYIYIYILHQIWKMATNWLLLWFSCSHNHMHINVDWYGHQKRNVSKALAKKLARFFSLVDLYIYIYTYIYIYIYICICIYKYIYIYIYIYIPMCLKMIFCCVK